MIHEQERWQHDSSGECEEDAVAELNKVHRDYKVKKKLPYYEEYYRSVDSDAFLNKQVIGSNRYSFGVLQGLSGKSIKRDSDLARGDFDEDMAFLTNYYVNHFRGCIGWEVSTSLNISYHAIQRVYQRKIAAEMDFATPLSLNQKPRMNSEICRSMRVY